MVIASYLALIMIQPMKNLVTTLALVAGLLASPAMRAQDMDDDGGKKTPEERAKHRTEVMTKELGLNAEQVAKVNTININFARTVSDLKQIKDEATRKGRMDTLKANRDNSLKAVLTPEQYTKMTELRAKKKEEHDKKEKKKHNE